MVNEIEFRGSKTPSSGDAAGRSAAMRSELDRVFDQFLGISAGFRRFLDEERAGGLLPSMDFRNTDEAFVVEVEQPGLEEKDLEVASSDRRLVIQRERKSDREEKQDEYHVSECSGGAFRRSLRLPDGVDVDYVGAELAKGVRTVASRRPPRGVRAAREIQVGTA